MPRLESQFSVQVTQPYLNEPFPIRAVEPNEDRLFKHITFHEDDPAITLRLRAINRSYITESMSIQKRVPTNLSISDSQSERFRIKAVLSQPEHGVSESHWVMQHNMDAFLASSHNQYRVRGISKESWKGDWVYSELRDFENDLIVYNMLYDILDLLTNVHDDQIDYLMDYMVFDTFIKILKEKEPEMAKLIDPEEFKIATITEWLSFLSNHTNFDIKETFVSKLGENFSLLADELKKEFKENVMSSPTEFSMLYRVYSLFEQYNSKKQDALTLLLELFLEDRLDKLVQKTDIEVLLQNDEEMGIYLNGVYEFDIKNELITSVYDASPNDSFVTKLDDAVQLLSEPVVFENLVYHPDEEVSQFLRMALSELYVPFVAMDQRLLELESELEDNYDGKPTGNIVEYDTTEGDNTTRYLFLYDVVKTLIKGDLDLTQDYEIIILDYVLKAMNDSQKMILIDYYFGESVEILLDLGESFRYSYNKVFGQQPIEQTQIHMTDRSVSEWSTRDVRLKELYPLAWRDSYRLVQVKTPEMIKEGVRMGLLDSLINQYQAFKESVQNKMDVSFMDAATQRLIYEENQRNESFSVNPTDQTMLNNSKHTLEAPGEKITSVPEEAYYNLFKHFLRDPNRYPILEKKQVELSHDLRDKFFIDGTDVIQYALGDMDDGWPLGVFRLGINTLKGEVSSS